jgi:hypothetical protein
MQLWGWSLNEQGWFSSAEGPTSSEMDTWDLLAAWHGRLPVDAVFACSTAAWMHGLDAKPANPIDIIMPVRSSIRSRRTLTVRRSTLKPEEVTTVRALPATTVHRTLRDLALFHPRVEALVGLDGALFKKLTTKSRLLDDPVTARRRRGSKRLRRLIDLAEPAESPMETRLRWLLVHAGLPTPEVQTDLHDAQGRFVGRADLFYRGARLVIEFDGGNHRERLVSDDRRQNLLMNAGFRVLRFTTADVHQRSAIVESQVRSALGPVRRVA